MAHLLNFISGRHYSLPVPATVPYPPPASTPRSCSVGSTFPHQETTHPRGPSLEQVHPSNSAGGMHQFSTVNEGNVPSSTTQKPAIPIPALSQEGLSYSMLNYAPPGLEAADLWHENRSLSTSGSLQLNYNSYPSSHNASQEAFQLQRVPMAANDALQFGVEVPPHFTGARMQMPAEYYAIPRSAGFLSSPVQHNWYQHNSLGNLPVHHEDPPHPTGQGSFDHRFMQSQHNSSRRKSAADVMPHPEYLRHGFSHPQMIRYYTPPHNRRCVTPSPKHPQSISEYPGLCEQTRHIPLGRRRDEVTTPTEVANSALSAKPTEANSEMKCVNLEAIDKKLKELAALRDCVLNNDEVETVQRRRTNSLHRDSDHNARSSKATNRFSLVSAGELQRSVSNGNGNMSVTAENSTNQGFKGKLCHMIAYLGEKISLSAFIIRFNYAIL